MTPDLRIADPATDYPRVAALLTLAEREPTIPDDLHEDDARVVTGKMRRRIVAHDPQGEVVGYGEAVYYPSEPKGNFHTLVVVDPTFRGQGLGTALYNEVAACASSQGATVLHSVVQEENPVGLRFAEQRGFAIRNHALEWRLDLTQFDAGPFEGVIEAVEAGGIRFFSYAETGNTPEAQARLYEINRIAAMDDPASPTKSYPTFANWQRIVLQASWFQPEGQIIAADGDVYAGLTAIQYNPDTQSAESLITGVVPAYRGRKIAQALKLLAIRNAQALGAVLMTTETDSRNTQMAAINRKLGYKQHPGYFGIVKSLA